MNPILKKAQNNIFFHDFISLLKEIEKDPLEITATGNGNIKVKEIKRLGKIFQHDIYHRDRQGNIMFAVRTEDDFPYIWWHKQIAKVMGLTYTRSKKIRLSKNGKDFLHKITPDIQFQEMICWYFQRADWRYTNLYRSEIVGQLQDNQLAIWQFLLELDDDWISTAEFYKFLENLIPELSIAGTESEAVYSEYDSICRVIYKALLRLLDTFDLIDTEKESSEYGDLKIVHFRLNQVGKMILIAAMFPI